MSYEADARAQGLLSLTQRLADIIGKETGLLRAGAYAEARDLLDEKGRLAGAYRHEFARLAKEKTGLPASPAVKAALTEATKGLQRLMRQHEAVLGGLKDFSENFVKSLAAEVTAQRRGPQRYGAQGAGERPKTALAGGFALDTKA
ncbi:MAG TPA: hypothetical protein DCZ49_03285 [Hyphomonadaceae bacterium]|nr:hypothetical protein [Hyphomonadaceae bacterium]